MNKLTVIVCTLALGATLLCSLPAWAGCTTYYICENNQCRPITICD